VGTKERAHRAAPADSAADLLVDADPNPTLQAGVAPLSARGLENRFRDYLIFRSTFFAALWCA
jgi:hypothetical protein